MACTNCFNGCAEIISDKCVKYTGVDIPGLGIATGDTLLNVENKITDKILTLMNGTGIIPIIDQAEVCDVVEELMPCCPPFDLNVILNVYLKAICALNVKNEGLKDRIIVLETAMNALNANYTIGCLTGVTATSDTHEIVQAIINKVCGLETELHDFYTKTDDLDDYIANYLAGLPTSDLYSNKMIPYVAVPYFGPLTGPDGDFFGSTGAGIGKWDRIFLCNGKNNTPDLRGRVLVGVTDMAGIATDAATVPGGGIGGLNPTYTINGGTSIAGSNGIILEAPQLPLHTHDGVTATSVDSGHAHSVDMGKEKVSSSGNENAASNSNSGAFPRTTTTGFAKITTDIIFPLSGGNGVAHSNIQPSRGAYFIIYIP